MTNFRLAAWLLALLISGCAHVHPDAAEGRIYEAGENALQVEVIRWFAQRGLELQRTSDPHVLITRVREREAAKATNTLEGRRSGMGYSQSLANLDPGDLERERERERTAQLDDRTREATREFHQEIEDAPIRLAETPKGGAEVGPDGQLGGTRIAIGSSSTREDPWGKSRMLYLDRDQWRVQFVSLGPERTRVLIFRSSSSAWDSSADRSYQVGSSASGAKVSSGPSATVQARDRQLETGLAEHLDFSAAVEVLGDATKDYAAPPLELPPVVEAAKPPVPSACGVDVEQVADAFRPGASVLVADLAGTGASTLAFQGIICRALETGRELAVGLSMSASEQGRLNRFLSSDGGPAARAALLQGPFWRSAWPDGRSSVATLELLEQLRRWHLEGKRLTVLALDVDVPGNARTAFVSARILEHLRKHPGRMLIGSLANTQVATQAGADWNPSFLPVGYRLAAAGSPVTSFDVAFVEGTQWTCRLFAFGRLKCGTWTVRPGPRQIESSAPRHQGNFVRRFAFPSKEGFDGRLFIGQPTASPPAVPAKDDLGDAAR